MKFDKTWQKRLTVERTLRRYSSSYGFARNGERNPFYFPCVVSLSMLRSREDRRAERRVISRGGLSLLSSIVRVVEEHPELKTAISLSPGSRAYEDRDGTDVVIWAVDPDRVPTLTKVLRAALNGDPRLSRFSVGPIHRGQVAPLMNAMFHEVGESPSAFVVYV